MTTNIETPVLSLADARLMKKANMGTPANIQNAATAMAGLKVVCENTKGEFVVGVILPTLSKGGGPGAKIQAELACSVEGCTRTHIREQSDWHQALMCREHAEEKATSKKLTDEEKLARKVAKARELLAKIEAPAAI